MLTGFALHADARVEVIHTKEEIVRAWRDEPTTLWLDYAEPTGEELAALARVLELDEASIDDCLRGEQRPRLDEFDNYIFLVLYAALAPTGERFNPRKLAVFVGARYLVTVHHEPIRAVSGVLDRCGRTPDRSLAAGADAVLFSIIDAVVDNYLIAVEEQETLVEALEDRSLDPDVDESVLIASSALRRELLAVRGLAVAQRELLLPIARGECDYVADTLGQRFGHVRDHLTQVAETVDSLRDHLAAVRENYNTSLANRTNAIMKTLTLMATVMLPLTLIAGIYGMNLPLWPPPEHPLSFWVVLSAMAATTAGLLVYFRKKGWI